MLVTISALKLRNYVIGRHDAADGELSWEWMLPGAIPSLIEKLAVAIYAIPKLR